jgi:hypothetical protein
MFSSIQSIISGVTPGSGACSIVCSSLPSSSERTVMRALDMSRISQSKGSGSGIVHLAILTPPHRPRSSHEVDPAQELGFAAATVWILGEIDEVGDGSHHRVQIDTPR